MVLRRDGPVQVLQLLGEEIPVLLFVVCCAVECRVQLLQSLNSFGGQNLLDQA